MSDGRVNVTIYGQSYVVSGGDDAKTIRLAEYVDKMMNEIAENVSGSLVDIAVLTALNIADDFSSYKDTMRGIEDNFAEIEAEKMRYAALWEEARQNLQHYKEERNSFNEKREDLQSAAAEKDREAAELRIKISELETLLNEYKEKNRELESRLDSDGSGPASCDADERIRELESDYFDLEMENVRLKSELAKLAK